MKLNFKVSARSEKFDVMVSWLIYADCDYADSQLMKSMLRLQQRILHVHRHFRFPSHQAPGNRKLVIFDSGNAIFISPLPLQAEFCKRK